jgi:outer membrane receptor for ferrienterochelin and colicins
MRKKFPTTKALLLSTVFIGLPAVLTAQEDEILLDTIILSAAGIATDPLTAPASVTVVTGEELATSGVTDLGDALRSVPGVAVTGSSDAENIFIRGMPTEYTVIMVDGNRVDTRATRTNGSGGIEHYYIPPVSMIERIEVVRGPMSSLHGSDAMGGVINIITKPVSDSWTGSATVESTFVEDDEDSTERQLSFHLNGPIVSDTLGLQIWGRKLDRSASLKTRGPGERELSDLHARLTWTPTDSQELSLELGQTEIESTRNDIRRNAALGHKGTAGGWDLTSNLSFEHSERETSGSTRKPELTNTILDTKASNEFDWNGVHAVTLGGQVWHSSLTDQNTGLGDGVHYDFDNTQWALFAEDVWEVSPTFTATLGGRYTHDERFGGKFTPRAFSLLEVSSGLFVTAGISTGYRTPELRESVDGYYLSTNRGAAVIPGNPDLKPEESTSYELGLRFQNDRSEFGVTAYHTDIKNRIETRDTGTTTVVGGSTVDLYESYNVGRARVRGVELSAKHHISESLEISASFSANESERLTGTLAGQPLARTPDRQASLRLDWVTPVDGLNIWASANYVGDSVQASSTSRGTTITNYQGYGLVDLGANYALNDRVTLKTVIENLADVDVNSTDHGKVLNGRTLSVLVTTTF